MSFWSRLIPDLIPSPMISKPHGYWGWRDKNLTNGNCKGQTVCDLVDGGWWWGHQWTGSCYWTSCMFMNIHRSCGISLNHMYYKNNDSMLSCSSDVEVWGESISNQPWTAADRADICLSWERGGGGRAAHFHHSMCSRSFLTHYFLPVCK